MAGMCVRRVPVTGISIFTGEHKTRSEDVHAAPQRVSTCSSIESGAVANSQHHGWEHALQGVRKSIQLARHRSSTLGRVLKGIRNSSAGPDESQHRQSDLRAPHQIAEKNPVQGDAHGELPSRPEPAKQEHRADNFNDGDGGEVAHVEVVDKVL